MTTTRSTPGISVTTSEHPNATRLREGFEAFARGDLEPVRALMATQTTWRVAGSSPISGTYGSWEEIAGMIGRTMEITGGTFTVDLVSLLADDGHAVAIHDATSTVGGQTETHRHVLVSKFDADGKVRATYVMAYDQEADDQHLSH